MQRMLRRALAATSSLFRGFSTEKSNVIKPLVSIYEENGKTVVDFKVDPNQVPKSDANEIRVKNLVALIDGYMANKGHHLNVNVLSREMLLDAIDHPEKYPTLTIRISGYAVAFNKLSKEQQLEIANRTFHDKI